MDVRGRRIASAPGSPRSVAECVSGVLTRSGAVLVEKRRADDEADPGLALLPGGHVETGESDSPVSTCPPGRSARPGSASSSARLFSTRTAPLRVRTPLTHSATLLGEPGAEAIRRPLTSISQATP